MAVTATKYPGTLASETIPGGNSTDWVNPSNAGADDTSETEWSVSTASADQGPYLKSTNYSFTSSDVPSGATIDGKGYEYRRREVSSVDNVTTNRLREIKGGTIGGSNVSTMNTVEWVNDSTEAGSETITEGGASNLWNNTWTANDVWASDTGEALAPNGAGTTPNCFIDFVRTYWYYTAASVFVSAFEPQIPAIVRGKPPPVKTGLVTFPFGVPVGETIRPDKWLPEYPDIIWKAKSGAQGGKVVFPAGILTGENINIDKWQPQFPDQTRKAKPLVPEGKTVFPVGIIVGETIRLDKWQPQFPSETRKAKSVVGYGINVYPTGITAKETIRPDKWLPSIPDQTYKAKPLVPEGKFVFPIGILTGEEITLDKWQPQYPDQIWSEKSVIANGTVVYPHNNEFIFPDKWLPSLPDRIFARTNNTPELSIGPIFIDIPPPVEDIFVDKWQPSLQVPIRTGFNPAYFVTIAALIEDIPVVPPVVIPPSTDTGGGHPLIFTDISRKKRRLKPWTDFQIEQEDELLLILLADAA